MVSRKKNMGVLKAVGVVPHRTTFKHSTLKQHIFIPPSPNTGMAPEPEPYEGDTLEEAIEYLDAQTYDDVRVRANSVDGWDITVRSRGRIIGEAEMAAVLGVTDSMRVMGSEHSARLHIKLAE